MADKVKMHLTDTKTVTVTPKELRFIPDLLEKRGRVEEEQELTLNAKEIKRAMQNAVVTEGDVVLDETNYNYMDAPSEDDGEEEVDEGEAIDNEEDAVSTESTPTPTEPDTEETV